MRHPNQQRDPSDGPITMVAYALGAIITFLGWPGVFYGSIDTAQAYAAQNYSFFPTGLIAFFWGLLTVAGLFGGTAMLSILAIRFLQATLGGLLGGGR